MTENSKTINLLMDIPTVLCRNMNQQFVSKILKDIKSDFSQHHFMILKLLNEKGKLYVTEIVEFLKITKPQMTASVDKLIRLNYVIRENDKKDRRKIYLTITKSGIEITNRIIKKINNLINENLTYLSDKEVNQLEKGLDVLYRFCLTCK